MTFALDLFQVELGLDSLDAYVSRRMSHQRQRTIGSVLAAVHQALTEQIELGFGGDDDDF